MTAACKPSWRMNVWFGVWVKGSSCTSKGFLFLLFLFIFTKAWPDRVSTTLVYSIQWNVWFGDGEQKSTRFYRL